MSNVDDIYKKADDYAEVHGISHVAVKFSTARGYYLSLPMEMASNLPNEFIQPTKSGKFIHCSTEEVQSLKIDQEGWEMDAAWNQMGGGS